MLLHAVDHRWHWLLVVLFLFAFLRVMEASIGDSCTVGEPGACCWLRWGLGHGLLFLAAMEDWAPLDRFFHSNHSCSGRTVASSPPLPVGHAPGCRSALPAASRRQEGVCASVFVIFDLESCRWHGHTQPTDATCSLLLWHFLL